MQRRGHASVVVSFLALVGASSALAAAEPQQPAEQLVVVYAPKVARAGERIGDAPRVRLLRNGAPVAGSPVTLSIGTAGGAMDSRAALTGADGVAVFDTVRILGRPGPMRLVFSGPAATETATLDLVLGPPRRVVILRQPSSRIVADVPLQVQPVVRAVDGAGNAVSAVEVLARLCADTPATARDGERCAEPSAELKGTVVARTDESGAATFTDLAVIGPGGTYRLDFGILANDAESADNRQSIAMRYDPERESNRSHVVVSAIKSVAGQVPRNEFFDLRFRFRYTDRVFSLASMDVALANRQSDTVKSDQAFLTEASASLNHAVLRTRDAPTQLLERSIFVGLQMRVFNTLPYYGVHVGSVEHARSAFQGSYFTFGVLRSVGDTMNVIGADTIVSQRWSLSADFFLRSSSVAFFETLNVRAGILFPLRRGGDLQSRITIAVPIGSIEFF